MNYDNLTDEEVAQKLREEADWTGRMGNEVMEPRDVLYWLDAFGDLSLAINCQGLPKDLPDSVVREINEYDVLNDWEGDVNETECPICNTDFYVFPWKHDYLPVSEWGDLHDYVEYVSDPAGFYWDTSGEHSMMCQACRESRSFSRMRPEPASGEVRVFYGESDEFSRFSHTSGVVRWDFEWDMDYDKSTDLFNLRAKDNDELISGQQIAASFAKGHSSRNAMMERLGFKRIHVKEIDQSTKGIRQFWRHAHEVLSGWAKLDSKTMTREPTHPDLNFTYIIEGQYQAWVPEEHFEKFQAELVWQSLREANDYERAEQYREDHDDLLAFQYYEVA